MQWSRLVREIPDFPMPGVLFRDVLPVMADATAWQDCLAAMEAIVRPLSPQILMAPEARGYLLAAPLADRLRIGLVPIRKPGKLPGPVLSQQYALEYGENRLEMEAAAPLRGLRVVVVDDVLATGGTVQAARRLAQEGGGKVAGFAFLIELQDLGGRRRLTDGDIPVVSALVL